MRVLVWDAPTRLFHWLYALAFALAWLTAESDLYRDLHVFAGYLFLGLLGFRLLWGLAGSRYARFGAFRFGPGAGLRYLRDALAHTARRYLGHNPAGAWAVYGLLALGAAVSLSGMLVLGGEERHGPFKGIATFAVSGLLKESHEVVATLMLWLVFGHLAGVFAESRLHRENLTRAMFTGRKEGAVGDGIASSHGWVGALLFATVAGFGNSICAHSRPPVAAIQLWSLP